MKLKNKIYQLTTTIMSLSTQAKREGLLTLTDSINDISEKDFRFGLQLVIDGTDAEYIEQFYDNIILSNKMKGNKLILIRIMKAGILSLQAGDNLRVLALKMYTLIPKKIKFDLEKLFDFDKL